MGQWGTERTVHGARFIPHVETNTFDPAGGSSVVGDVLLLDSGGDEDLARQTLEDLRATFVGGPYSAWVSPNASGKPRTIDVARASTEFAKSQRIN